MPRQMNDSGLQWVGKIPVEWEVAPLYSTVRQVKNLNVGNRERNLLSLSYGRIKRKDIDTATGLVPVSYAGYNIIESGDIVLRLTDLQNDKKSIRVGLSKERGIVTSAYVTIRPSGKASPDYLAYSILAFDIAKGFYGIGSGVRQGLTYDEVKKLKFQFPPLPEQEAIAAFLDSVTGKIDALRGKLKREIDRFEDYKKSAITKAVCHGLDPKAKMKDSGIPWVGKVPECWTVQRIESCFREVTQTNTSGKITKALKFCFGEIVPKENFDPNEDAYVAETISKYTIALPHDIMVNGLNLNFDLVSLRVAQVREEGVITSAYIAIRLRDERTIDPFYVKYLLKSYDYSKALHNMGRGVRKILTYKELKKHKLIFPPLPEQREIAAHIDTMVGRVNAIVEKRKRQLDALDKLKRTVVYDYVTGKREVPLPKGGRSR